MKEVHVVIENGCVTEAYADDDVEVIVYDLDNNIDMDQRDHVEASLRRVKQKYNEVAVY